MLNQLCQQVIAEYLQKIDPKSDGAKRDWVAIYDECANVLYEVFLLNEFTYKFSILQNNVLKQTSIQIPNVCTCLIFPDLLFGI